MQDGCAAAQGDLLCSDKEACFHANTGCSRPMPSSTGRTNYPVLAVLVMQIKPLSMHIL